MIVENKLTPLSAPDAAAALAAAYQQLVGVPPSEPVLALLIAQSALETDNWRKIHNFNFGNQKAGASYPLIVQFRCSEIVNGAEKFFDPPAPECNFRAYQSAAAGALDYLRVLHARPHWWQGLQTEDPSAFVDALATPPKYFTANPALYKSVLIARLQQFGPLAVGVLERPAHPPASLQMDPPCSSLRRATPMALPVLAVLSLRRATTAVPRPARAADSDSRSAWGYLPSGSWLVPLEDLVEDDSGVRRSVSCAVSAVAIQSAPRSSPLGCFVRFIVRFVAHLFGRRAT